MSRARIAPAALTVLYTLKRNRHLPFLAGGSVRDLLIGRTPKDFDVVTDATPARVKKLFRRCRLVGRRFRLCHVLFANDLIEVATFRRAVDAGDDQDALEAAEGEGNKALGERPRVVAREGMIVRDNEFGTPAEDALRRDFTINALFYDIRDFSVIDYAGGLDDLRRGVIRSIGDPQKRFVEDPVRMLRAIRFSAVLGFEIDPLCRSAIQGHRQRLALANHHRLYDEWLKVIGSGALADMGNALLDAQLLEVILPDFARWLTAGDADRRRRFVKACGCLDACRRRGAPTPADLTFALMMGEYFEDLIAAMIAKGAAWYPAAQRVVSDALAPNGLPMTVPRSVVQNVARIIGVQNRFRPGYRGGRRRRFREQAVFAPAFEVFRFLCEACGRPAEWLNAWDDAETRHVLHSVADTSPSLSRPAPRRRRRRPRSGKPHRRPAEG